MELSFSVMMTLTIMNHVVGVAEKEIVMVAEKVGSGGPKQREQGPSPID